MTSSNRSGGDVYEPDNTIDEARVIATNGISQTHGFHFPGDVDWVSFSATGGTSYVMQTLNLGPSSDTVLYLYDTDGATPVTWDDDSGGNLSSRIAWTAPTSGTYYLGALNYSSAYGSGASYDLQASSAVCGGGDTYESDNAYTLAGAIATTGATQTRTFGCADDNDWVKFSAVGGTRYTIQTLNLGADADTYLYLYDTDGRTLLAQDDDGGGALASAIGWTAPTTGTYYLMVRNYDGSVYGSAASYDLKVVVAGTGAPDAYEPDDSTYQAWEIVVGGSAQTHNIHQADDVDWVKFTATAGVTYTIETLNLGPDADTLLYLYSTNGVTFTLETMDDDSGGGFASQIVWAAPTTGAYYVAAIHYSANAYGAGTSYDLRVTTGGASAASGATVRLAAGVAGVGGEVEATVYVQQAAAAIKVEALAKPSYLRLTGTAPLSAKGKAEGPSVTADKNRWHTLSEANGRTSVRYSGKQAWDGAAEYPAVQLRWQVTSRPPNGKVIVPVRVTTVDQNGTVTVRTIKLSVATSGTNPKINDVEPKTYLGDVNSAISIRGSNFVDTPKVHLRSNNGDYLLPGVVFVDSGNIWATVPAGTKAGSYKVELVNPDNGSVQFSTGISVTAQSPYRLFFPVVARGYGGGW